ncbi:hypothetical protein AVEN_100289-1 [Araneus ventricosus]|uniref:Uncharacterized protein n=1 Tax=Araneus ventricosus TaxID=182803 RepID=A0A4Y2DHC0_ARAVE|nr:hypothetical protein AVEN_100289-1 [Araneus ventricosus]
MGYSQLAHWITRKPRSTPALPKHPGHLNDSRCNSSSTEAGYPNRLSPGHGPIPPDGSTYYHWRLKHPGKQLKDRPSQQIVGHCGSCIIAPITSGSCSNPPFCRGTTRLRKWVQRATPPLLCHRVDESLLTYTAASPPRTHGVPQMGAQWIRQPCYCIQNKCAP